jgi:sugar/nucleoside kinase (ribokinase family)
VTAPQFDVLGIGESSIDEVFRLPGLLGANVKLPVSSRHIRYGGQVATTLATCASLGLRAALLGTVGNDSEGLCKALGERGVDTTLLIRRPVRHRRAMVLVSEPTGDRAVLWERDARLALTPGDIPRETIEAARLLHVDDVDVEASIVAARFACGAGIPVTSDIEHITDRTRELIAAVTVPILAEHVPRALTGEADLERALRAMRTTHGSGLLCVTLGSRGSMLLHGDQVHHVPAPTVRAVDATGAGDVFRGAFIYALLRGDSPVNILRFANVAAALSCTREGALDSVPTRREVEEFFKGKGQRAKGKGQVSGN